MPHCSLSAVINIARYDVIRGKILGVVELNQ